MFNKIQPDSSFQQCLFHYHFQRDTFSPSASHPLPAFVLWPNLGCKANSWDGHLWGDGSASAGMSPTAFCSISEGSAPSAEQVKVQLRLAEVLHLRRVFKACFKAQSYWVWELLNLFKSHLCQRVQVQANLMKPFQSQNNWNISLLTDLWTWRLLSQRKGAACPHNCTGTTGIHTELRFSWKGIASVHRKKPTTPCLSRFWVFNSYRSSFKSSVLKQS